jgi:hypothetical protein
MPFQANSKVAIFVKVLANQRQRQVAETHHRCRVRRRTATGSFLPIGGVKRIFGAILREKSILENAFEAFDGVRKMEQDA